VGTLKEVTVSTVVIFLNIFCVPESLSIQVGLKFGKSVK
jgi:hypothetical protein